MDSSEAGTPVGKAVLRFFEKHGVVVKPLASDYAFLSRDGVEVCVERSTVSDFYGKIVSGRLFEQLHSELEKCSELYYVVTNYAELGKIARFQGGKAVAVIEGAVTSVSRNTVFVPLWREHSFPHWLERLYEKEALGKGSVSVGRGIRKREKPPCELAVELLATLPGIGGKTAREMLNGHSLQEVLFRMLTEGKAYLAQHVSLKNAELIARILGEKCVFNE
ncbi:MAG: hypothetical protein QXY20_07120 [Thermofilum sp.]|uniref:ERCC4 domain-containing protein n=1 Tax=Thermofilum sp. TaxID=1961369 RepID=UPI00315F9864